jgi:tryptophan halogenase
MRFRTEVEPDIVSGNAKLAERAMRDNMVNTERLRAGLPRHRELIRKVVEVGMQQV